MTWIFQNIDVIKYAHTLGYSKKVINLIYKNINKTQYYYMYLTKLIHQDRSCLEILIIIIIHLCIKIKQFLKNFHFIVQILSTQKVKRRYKCKGIINIIVYPFH